MNRDTALSLTVLGIFALGWIATHAALHIHGVT